MNPEDTRRAMSAMYQHDDTALAEHSASGRGGDQLEGVGIRDMPEFRHGPKGPFVDRIEPAPPGSITGDIAVLLMPDGSTQEVPANKLPHGTREGAYLGADGLDDLLGEKKDIEDIRARRSAGDDGKDFAL